MLNGRRIRRIVRALFVTAAALFCAAVLLAPAGVHQGGAAGTIGCASIYVALVLAAIATLALLLSFLFPRGE